MPDEKYLALYRKYRPNDFDDVRGRDAIVRTLKNQIISGRIGHSYLFCGTRGTGKTTIARIFARAANCENQHDGNPCGECPTCRAIQAEANLNVTELDAASNNSVDDIRSIVDQVEYSPTQGRFRVFIIDEVHMLSNAAFNALLKTLEEPPSYVIFILATTEKHKIIPTILSRCQRLNIPPLDPCWMQPRIEPDERQYFFDKFCAMMRLSYMRRIFDMRDWSVEMAGLGRQRQQDFLQYAQSMIRENFILCLLGFIVGIPTGIALHRFVISQIKMDIVAYKVLILPMSYVYSLLLVILFSLGVDLMMRGKIRRIDMTESLKSIE